MQADLEPDLIELAPVRPDPPYTGDRALADADGEIGGIAEIFDPRTRRLRARPLLGDLLDEARGPDQRAAHPRRAIDARDRRTLLRARNARTLQWSTLDGRPAGNDRTVDQVARQRAGRPADHRSDRAEQAADSRAGSL